MEEVNNNIWKIIDCYFRDNPQSLVRHHTESFNDFFKRDIFRIVKEMNPMKIVSKLDETSGDFMCTCNLYIGGKDGTRLYFAKPTIYDDNTGTNPPHYMFPNEARLRNMTYSMTIHYDIEVEVLNTLNSGELADLMKRGGNAAAVEEVLDGHTFQNIKNDPEFLAKIEEKAKAANDDDIRDYKGGSIETTSNKETIIDSSPVVGGSGKGKKSSAKPLTVSEHINIKESVVGANVQKTNFIIEKILLGRFPIMVQSDFCILSGLSREMRFNMGECRNDQGGYFIIDGKEKSIVPQEKFGDNMLRINKSSMEEILYSAEIKSVSEDASKPVRSLRIDLVAPTSKYTNKNIVVSIPNVRKPVPLFIVFRALGITTDKEIIEACLLDIDKYSGLVDLFIPSVHDAGPIMTRTNALQYIAQLAKVKTTDNALLILTDYLLPHIGETNFREKAYFLGYMTQRLLLAYSGLESPIDRDSYRYKRLELTGTMIYQLFREYYKAQTKSIHLEFERRLLGDRLNYDSNLEKLIRDNYRDIFSENRVLEIGFRKAFKGNWGSTEHTKRIGAVQDLNRLSFNSALSHLRKTNLAVNAGAKLVGPRVLNGSQWGIFDPIDTPDGGNIGLHKQLTIMSYVSRNISREPMLRWLRKHTDIKPITDYLPKQLATMTKIIVNGYWAGVTNNALKIVDDIRFYRRIGLLPLSISLCFDIRQNTINLFTDGGRIMRPIFYKHDDTGLMSFAAMDTKAELSWRNLVNGFNALRKDAPTGPNYEYFYELGDIYDIPADSDGNPYQYQRFMDKKSVVEYIDPNEEETSLIALKPTQVMTTSAAKSYSNCEIHESLIFGMMSNLIIYPQHNPASRNSFSCGQSKQAVSLYHTNYNMRMDKTAVILNQGQRPLVKSRFLEYINNEENSYGENAIVAIACYTGYNVEDAILINEGALKRGLFRTTYFSVYETHEEKSAKTNSFKKFGNIEASQKAVVGLKAGYDYSQLDENGLVKEGTQIDEKVVLIGCMSGTNDADSSLHDESKMTKKGQLGVVDKTFITEGEEGTRIAKVRIREERMPAIGDKMASRSGQKGTIGMIIREADMPFTSNGVRPDLIINPHAIPTRMTIGQLVECIVGKACVFNGSHGDCTAFMADDSQLASFGRLLTKSGFHSSGNEVLYNGMTGEQIESEIFMGPTYYMRLKHMVKDKVNFRATGPRTQLTRQPVSGRANDGGLRIGEMERDAIISHGATDFLRESMLVRGDQYYMAVCNKTGGVAIYNPEKNLFLSPLADGPIKYTDALDGKSMNVEQVTKYGRSFSIVRVPYVFKLFMQELQTMNIRMALITEDNVNQFDSMNFSANISLLSGLKTPNDIIKQIIENKDADEIVKRNKNVFRKIGEQKYTPDYDKPDVSPTISPSVAQRTASIGEARTQVEEETYVEAWHNVPEAPYDNMYGSPEGSPVANPYGSPEGSPVANPYGSPEGSPLGTPDLRVPGIVFADSVNNLPPGYNSEGKVLYNEETGADYIFDPSIGHYIDPLTQKIVIRKDFVQQQQQPTFKIGDIVYLISSASSPNQWTITNIMDKNIILENTGTKAAKVVSADEITHTPPMSGGAVQQTSRSAIHEGTPSGITFAPNIIIASGDNSQITAPKPVINEQPHIDFDKPLIKTTQTTGSSSDNSYSNDSLSGDKSSGDKSSSQDLSSGDLSTGGFVVKMV
jgi:DNA-directed RNA polymerase II subunit RPB2